MKPNPVALYNLLKGAVAVFLAVFVLSQKSTAQTCVFNSPILASNKPFDFCPAGVDTIIIRDTLFLDVLYEPIIAGLPFEGVMIVDGGVIDWTSSNVYFKLGFAAKLLLINGGKIIPNTGQNGCNGLKTLFFDTQKLASCSGANAPHAFADINQAGCITNVGICCNAIIAETDNSGFPNDRTLCQPGDTATLEAGGSGNLNYNYLWSPNIGIGDGPFNVAPNNSTTYTVYISSIFDPFGPEPAYLLTCDGAITIKINPDIQVTATTTPVPCAVAATGKIVLNVSGGTAPFTYKWTHGPTTKDLNNLLAGTYTCSITDARGCKEVATVTVAIVDNTIPTINCPTNKLDTAAFNTCSTFIPAIDASYSDNCPFPTLTYSLSGATSGNGSGQMSNVVAFNSGLTTASYTVSDGANNVSCSFTIQVKDIQFPTASNPPVVSGVQCLAEMPAPNTAVVIDEADNCSGVTVSHLSDFVAGGGGCINDTLIVLRRYQVTDAAGNASIVTQKIKIADSQPPFFNSVPSNLTVSCQSIPVVGMPIVSDNCNGPVTLTYIGETKINGSCTDSYQLKRRWTAMDNCGNTSSAEQTITVQDLLPPTFSFIPVPVTVNCSSIPTVGTPAATDNCDGSVSIVYNGETNTAGPCANEYTLQRRWTATDNCGNTATALQVITVQDLSAPAFTFTPSNTTVSCDAIPAVTTPVASDNCDSDVTIVYNGETRINGACPDTYTLTRQWTATDNCGNAASTQQVIAVQDVAKPLFTFIPPDVTVSCNAIPGIGNPVATDNCDGAVSINFTDETRSDGPCPETYTLTRRWLAVDNCGNTTTALQKITVQDVEKPVFTFIPANITVDCNAVPPAGNPTATDNCDAVVSIHYDGATKTDGACPDSYTLTRHWTASDNCGNTRSAEQTITVRDVTQPVFTFIPANTTVNCDAIPAVGIPDAADNCDEIVEITYIGESKTTGLCSERYTLSRRWTATDNCGNIATAEQIISVQDTTRPAFTFIPPDVTTSCESIPTPGIPLSSDNCDPAVALHYDGDTRVDGPCTDTYVLLRQWTATDNCGNSRAGIQKITVQDLVKPVFTSVPANITVNCDNIPTIGTPLATDNCDASVNITYQGETRNNGSCTDTYTLRRIWLASDNCGNTATAEQIISVQDTTAPVFTLFPSDLMVECNALPLPESMSASDNCGGNVDIIYMGEIRVDGACENAYMLLRHWKATDNCGNAREAEQILYVQDLTPPVFITVPPAITVSCDVVPAADTPQANDNCDAAVNVQYEGETRTDGNCLNTYTLTRQWRATDNCGNQNTTQQTIIVQDITQPDFTFVPANITVNCDAIPAVGVPTAADNCDNGVSITYTGEQRIDGPCAGNYTLQRSWLAKDACGNARTAIQTLFVQDTTRPSFTLIPADITVDCDAIPPVAAPAAADNCDAAVAIQYDGQTVGDGPCADTYVIKRYWTANDNCGNTKRAVQTLTVQDTTRPAFTFIPADMVVNCDAIPTVGTPTASDNCDASVNIQYDGEERTDGPCDNTFILKRRWTARDNCGNTFKAQQVLTVRDTTRPIFTYIPAPALVSCDAVPAPDSPIASDNCDAAVAIQYEGETQIPATCPNNYTLVRRWTARDNCGNTSMIEQTLEVKDLTPPDYTFVPADVVVNCETIPVPGNPTAADNCASSVSISYAGEIRTDGICPDNYLLTRTWVATDACGNTRNVAQKINVQDITSPQFLFTPADTIVNCESLPAPGLPTASDNCDAIVEIQFIGEQIMSSMNLDTYTMKRSWTAVDNCGNTTLTEQILTVQDTLAPQISCPSDFALFADEAICGAIVTYPTPQTTDNCSAQMAISATINSGSVIPIGLSDIQLKATDASGNFSVCTFTVFVKDTSAPVLQNCPADMTVTSPDANCEAVASWTPPTATDVCDNYVLTPQSMYVPGQVFPTGTTVVVYAISDTAGNNAACSFSVTVQETIPPVVSNCPPDMTLTTDTCTATAWWDEPTATDNCLMGSLTSTVSPGVVCPEGATIVQYTASDVWGNTNTCNFTITVVDIIPPQFSGCPPDMVVDAQGDCSTAVSWTMPTASDNCAPDPLVFAVPAPGSVFPVGHTPVHIFVQDASGNQDTCLFKVTVLGPPLVITNIPVNQSFIGCSAVANWDEPMLSGICGPYTLNATHASGDTFPIGVTTVQYTLSDTLGYTTTAFFTITVTESVPPEIECPASPIVVDVSGHISADDDLFILIADTIPSCEGIELEFELPKAFDNCGIPSILQMDGMNSGLEFMVGDHQLVFQATDDAGNITNCQVLVQVLPLAQLNPTVSDAIGCPGEDITLNAPVIPGATYYWQGPLSAYPNADHIVIEDLSAGYTGIYTVQAKINGCITPLDSALVRIGKEPDAVDDLDLEMEPNTTLDSISVLLNDQYEWDDFTLTLLTPLPGLEQFDDGTFSYTSGSKNEYVVFVYELCSEACPDLCDRAAVSITVREKICTSIPNIISPNGDGMNDYLRIPCLDTELYPENTLIIYNQWGDKVFEAAPYSNEPGKAWDGTLNGQAGKNLPDATYYYVFRPEPGNTRIIKGFVEVFR